MIPMANLAISQPDQHTAMINTLQELMNRGQYIGGDTVAAFEAAVADYLGVPHAISCASGTDALHLGLRALDIGPGDEVITTPFTFFATIEAIHYVGARPVFVDIDPHSFNLDPERVADAIGPATRAILPVHVFGQPVDMAPLRELAQKHRLHIVEDCAQSFGARYQGELTGTLGDVGCFSFFPTKNLGACGDGGLITVHSPALAERLRKLANHGSAERNRHECIGYNSRLDAFQAAVLQVKLPHCDSDNQARQRVARRYHEGLRDLAELQLPNPETGDHIYHQYTLLVPAEARARIQESLAGAGVASAIHYPMPAYRQPAIAQDHQGLELPVAEDVTRRCLSLPMFPTMSNDQVDTVINVLRDVMQRQPTARPVNHS